MTYHKPLPPLKRVRELLSYDEGSGVLAWREGRGGRRTGTTAGTVHPSGYIQVKLDGVFYLGHRLAWLLAHGQDPGEKQVDHINGQPTDNSIVNLRLATNQQNSFNQKPRRSRSQRKGVWLQPNGRWRACIQVGERRIHLGYHDTRDDAHCAYTQAANDHHGDYARAA
jgi:hypothetical protein